MVVLICRKVSKNIYRQVHDFAAPGAHHHNAVAESNIWVITSMARAIMLHAGIHGQEQADPALWPMAVAHAVYLHNHVPQEDTGLSPYDMFTRSQWPCK